MTINNTKVGTNLNKDVRKKHDQLIKRLNRLKKKANAKAGQGELYKGAKRDKQSTKLTQKQLAVLKPGKERTAAIKREEEEFAKARKKAEKEKQKLAKKPAGQ